VHRSFLELFPSNDLTEGIFSSLLPPELFFFPRVISLVDHLGWAWRTFPVPPGLGAFFPLFWLRSRLLSSLHLSPPLLPRCVEPAFFLTYLWVASAQCFFIFMSRHILYLPLDSYPPPFFLSLEEVFPFCAPFGVSLTSLSAPECPFLKG